MSNSDAAEGRIDAVSFGGTSQEATEQIYRCMAPLRDLLPADTQKCLAVVFEWAREGLTNQLEAGRTPELEAMHAALSYGRDVLIAAARKPRGAQMRSMSNGSGRQM